VGKAHSTEAWLLLGGIGLSGAAAQLLLTNSLRYGSAATVIVMDYTALLWATLYGWRIFEELPAPTTWIAAPIIILAGSIIVLREGHLARQKRRATALEEPLPPQTR
jgi:drug/metabolite transporter (DMT)-like permease